MQIVPIELAEANAFVDAHHRHHKPVTGHKFSLAVAKDGEVCGVAIVGRPVARMLNDGWTLEQKRRILTAQHFSRGAARWCRVWGWRKVVERAAV